MSFSVAVDLYHWGNCFLVCDLFLMRTLCPSFLPRVNVFPLWLEFHLRIFQFSCFRKSVGCDHWDQRLCFWIWEVLMKLQIKPDGDQHFEKHKLWGVKCTSTGWGGVKKKKGGSLGSGLIFRALTIAFHVCWKLHTLCKNDPSHTATP